MHRVNAMGAMRVRPFFWLLLVCACLGALTFAALNPTHVPALLRVHVDQPHPVAIGMNTLELHLTDPQGLPIDAAQVVSNAHMTNMQMAAGSSRVRSIGNGEYRVQLYLEMAGPWAITLQAQAAGFAPLQQTLYVQAT